MKWLSKLFGKSPQPSAPIPEETPNDDAILDEVTETDWVVFEASLTQLLEADLRHFAAANPGEEFCTIGLDCNAAYCDILLCANTTSALRESAIRYAKDSSEEAISAELEVMRWGFGDWKYHGFNLAVEGDWERYHQILPGGDELHSTEECERFLEAATRALIAIERGGALSLLRQSSDFAIACVDHDENIASATERLNRLRGTGT